MRQLLPHIFTYFMKREDGNFIDRVRIFVKAGNGGSGCMSFRREKFVPDGGPNGGNGGKGSDIFFQANRNLTTLIHLARNPHIEGKKGANGSGSLKDGLFAKPVTIFVPCGTIIKEGGKVIVDLDEHGATFLTAQGGAGGRGNASFKTKFNTAPRISEKGQLGQNKTLEIELKLVADVGLIGFPNVGKSTLLSHISAAKPKIADYPFTTLNPNLAVVFHKNKSFVACDIPGLIEGAHEGKGLGHKFLKHIERTRILIHMIDPLGFDKICPVKSVKIISEELKNFNKELSKRPKILVVNKADLPNIKSIYEKIKKRYRSQKVFLISAVTGEGLDKLLDEIIRQLSLKPIPLKVLTVKKSEIKMHSLEPAFKINHTADSKVEVTGEYINRLIQRTNFDQPESIVRLKNIFRKIGFDKELRKSGISYGDTVKIGDMEFVWQKNDYSGITDRLVSRRKRKP